MHSGFALFYYIVNLNFFFLHMLNFFLSIKFLFFYVIEYSQKILVTLNYRFLIVLISDEVQNVIFFIFINYKKVYFEYRKLR